MSRSFSKVQFHVHTYLLYDGSTLLYLVIIYCLVNYTINIKMGPSKHPVEDSTMIHIQFKYKKRSHISVAVTKSSATHTSHLTVHAFNMAFIPRLYGSRILNKIPRLIGHIYIQFCKYFSIDDPLLYVSRFACNVFDSYYWLQFYYFVKCNKCHK